MRALCPRLVLPFVLTLAGFNSGLAQESSSFPAGTPDEVGIEAAALEELAEIVAGYVADGRVVGAELLVIKERRTVLRRAFGMRDREAGTPLEVGALYNIRSMTKPIIGTAAQMLIDEGRLELATPVASIFPAFDTGTTREITVEHLLGHRAGFEWSGCMGGESLRALLECAAELGPTLFYPGTSFTYSNTGSNVLASILAERDGTSLEEVIETRVLQPLGLSDTFSIGSADEARLSRFVSAYADEGEGVVRAWSPEDGPSLPFLQGAQGLASTTTDYARFLSSWLDAVEGEHGFLSSDAVARALRPASLTELPTTFPERRVYYGQYWKLWMPPDSSRVEIFGHGGSDGTFAWALPGEDLMVLYFTQTVLTTTGIELEEEIDRLLLAPARATEAARFAPYVGTYWNEKERMVRVVRVDGAGALELDVVGTGSFTLQATEDPLRWSIPGREDFEVRFERDETGTVVGIVPPSRTGEGPSRRLPPAVALPSVEELMEARPSLAEHLGVFRLSGHFLKDGVPDVADILFSDGALRSREEVHRSKRGPQVTICNDGRVETITPMGRHHAQAGLTRDEAWYGRLAVLVGDWREYYDRVEVLARTERDDREAVIVQVHLGGGRPAYYVVDVETSLPVEHLRTLDLPIGSMGKVSTFTDYRDVEGVSIPFRWEGRFAADSLGTWHLQYEEIETHLEPDAALFALEASSGG